MNPPAHKNKTLRKNVITTIEGGALSNKWKRGVDSFFYQGRQTFSDTLAITADGEYRSERIEYLE